MFGHFCCAVGNLRVSTSHTATSSHIGWFDIALMSLMLMPAAPNAAWRSLPFGEAARIPVVTQGAANSVAAD